MFWKTLFRVPENKEVRDCCWGCIDSVSSSHATVVAAAQFYIMCKGRRVGNFDLSLVMQMHVLKQFLVFLDHLSSLCPCSEMVPDLCSLSSLRLRIAEKVLLQGHPKCLLLTLLSVLWTSLTLMVLYMITFSIAKVCQGLSVSCGPFHLTRCGLDRLKDTIYCVDIVPSQSAMFLRIWTHWISNNSWFPGSAAYGPMACHC